ncbi:ABC transporter ATP-binding protein [Sulfurimonas sp. MAG313]|nr:ATP-binding cassette domain-containing protein [Sulfurimonas sp. MAG313]MDF1881384.1 ABC transporter ATP-binding protein [Sulfurimonas sp. MAG313]
MKIDKLHISYLNETLVDISFEINKSLALVGQSGSGKSLSLKALLGMLPDSMTLDLDIQAPFELENGKTIAFVPQNPFTALSPLTKVKKQFFASDEKMQELFEQVGLDFELCERFPPELSGGQLQRVIIAMALSSEPKLLLLDEPTTALDPKNRDMIIKLLKDLQDKMGFKMLFVTHDMKSASDLCQDICVIKDGKMVEQGSLDKVLSQPKEEYTQVLISSNFSNREFRI